MADKKACEIGEDIIYKPFYTIHNVKGVLPLLSKVSYGVIAFLNPVVMYRLVNAEHILGSGNLEVGGLSAPSDKKELLEWLVLFYNSHRGFIVQGEKDVSLEFEKAVRDMFVYQTYVPREGEEI